MTVELAKFVAHQYKYEAEARRRSAMLAGSWGGSLLSCASCRRIASRPMLQSIGKPDWNGVQGRQAAIAWREDAATESAVASWMA